MPAIADGESPFDDCGTGGTGILVCGIADCNVDVAKLVIACDVEDPAAKISDVVKENELVGTVVVVELVELEACET